MNWLVFYSYIIFFIYADFVLLIVIVFAWKAMSVVLRIILKLSP